MKTNRKRLEFIKMQREGYFEQYGIHPLANVEDYGMGYEWDGEQWLEFPQKGSVQIGKNVRVGAFTSIKRGTLETDTTVIGDGCKIGSNVNIGHNVKIGKHCLILPMTTIGGSTEIGDKVVIWQGAKIAHKIKIGSESEIAMGAIVLKDVPAGTKVIGLWK